jgi:hypothetical protein
VFTNEDCEAAILFKILCLCSYYAAMRTQSIVANPCSSVPSHCYRWIK